MVGEWVVVGLAVGHRLGVWVWVLVRMDMGRVLVVVLELSGRRRDQLDWGPLVLLGALEDWGEEEVSVGDLDMADLQVVLVADLELDGEVRWDQDQWEVESLLELVRSVLLALEVESRLMLKARRTAMEEGTRHSTSPGGVGITATRLLDKDRDSARRKTCSTCIDRCHVILVNVDVGSWP